MITLLTAAQDFTSGWADLGAVVRSGNCQWLGIWLTVDINSTLNARVRARAQTTYAGGATDEYSLPIKTVSSADVKVEEEYLEFNVDADQLVILGIECNGVIPFIQFQVIAGTVGATPGQIDAAYVTRDNF